MIQNLILDLILDRNIVLLRGIGVLHLERQGAQLEQYSNTVSRIIPPYDTLCIQPDDQLFDVDIVDAISNHIGVSNDDAYRMWGDYLATEAVDDVLTIEGVAMIDLNQLSIIALDPLFAEQLTPDNDIIEIEPINQFGNNINAERVAVSPVQSTQQRTKPTARQQSQGLGTLGYMAVILLLGSLFYLIYFFTI